MRVAVTGGAGFIGQHVVRALLDAGHQVVAILNHQKLPIAHPNLKTTNFSLKAIASSPLAFARLHEPDVFIDLAWQKLDDYEHFSHIIEQPELHCQVIKNLINQGLKRVVGVGTCFEYGDAEGEISEQHPCKPTSNYAKGKLSLFNKLEEITRNTMCNFLWLRPFYVYGDNPNRMTLFSAIRHAIEQQKRTFILNSPFAKHDFLPVGRLAEMIAKLALDERCFGVFNCCSGRLKSVKEVSEEFSESQGGQLKFISDHSTHTSEGIFFWGKNKDVDTLL